MKSGKREPHVKILIVDDERVIADSLAVLLAQCGMETAAVYTGTAAIERSKIFRPDLIVSDIIMPDIDGIDAAVRIRRFLPDCRFLFFSGDAARADILAKATQKFGTDVRVLEKPIHPNELIARVPDQLHRKSA